jgi:hypothetical protein
VPSSKERRAAYRTRRVLSVLIAATGLALAACSSGPSSSGGPPARLGSSLATWQATRGSDGNGGYGSTIAVDGQSTAQFTAVATTDAKVTGWHQVFPSGTSLGHAEAAVRDALPADARQTASWRGSFSGGGGYCEFVSYQSASLASQLGTSVPTPTESNIGAKFYQVTPHHAGSPSIATVNSTQVSTTPYTLGEPC